MGQVPYALQRLQPGKTDSSPSEPCMRKLALVLGLACAVTASACDNDDNEFDDELLLNANPAADLVGTWAGTEEITSTEDVGSNLGVPGDRGFTFPVALTLDEDGTFALFTGNFSASFNNDFDRTCAGVFVRSSGSIKFFPANACRALPLTSYTIGRVATRGLTLQASTANTAQANQASIRVFLRLDRE